MDWLGAGHAEDACLSADEPGSEDMKTPELFSVTMIVHDGSRARQTLEGRRVFLECATRVLPCVREAKGCNGKGALRSSSATVPCGTGFPLTWLDQSVRLGWPEWLILCELPLGRMQARTFTELRCV